VSTFRHSLVIQSAKQNVKMMILLRFTPVFLSVSQLVYSSLLGHVSFLYLMLLRNSVQLLHWKFDTSVTFIRQKKHEYFMLEVTRKRYTIGAFYAHNRTPVCGWPINLVAVRGR